MNLIHKKACILINEIETIYYYFYKMTSLSVMFRSTDTEIKLRKKLNAKIESK